MLSTVRQIQTALDALARDGTGARLMIEPGFYHLDAPLTIRTDGVEMISFGGTAVFTGGRQVMGWERSSQQLWRAPLPPGASPRQLWCDDRRITRARHPNEGFLRWETALPGPFARWGLVYERGQGIEEWQLVGSDVLLYWSWTASRHRVIAHDAHTRTLLFDRPSRQAIGTHLEQSGRRFILEGAVEALDAVDEFAVVWSESAPTILLHAGAKGGEVESGPGQRCMVAVAGLTSLLQAEGSERAPLRGLRLENLTFEHTDWVLPPAPAMVDWQAAAHLEDATLVVRHAEVAGLVRARP